jgi:hypothetical protein
VVLFTQLEICHVTNPPKLLYGLFPIACVFLWACTPTRLEISPSPRVSSPTSIPAYPSPASPTVAPVLTPPASSTSPVVRDSIGIWESYIGLHGQKDHLIFHVITQDTPIIPRSIQILDRDTGQVTDSFPLEESPAPNLCAAEARKGKSYFRTAEVFFEHLPEDFWERLMGTSFTYLVEVEEPTGERVSIAIIEPPGGCTNLVE